MRAAVTEGVGAMALLDRPDPPGPGPGQVLVAPEAVVERNAGLLSRLVSHRFGLERALEALRFAVDQGDEGGDRW